MLFWLFYFAAQALHILAKAHATVRSNNSGITEYKKFFSVNWVPLLVRLAVATAFFKWWFDDPALVDAFFDKVGAQFSPGFLHDLIIGVHYPLNAGTSFIYGWAADSGLDKLIALLPWLRRDVPPIAGDAPQ